MSGQNALQGQYRPGLPAGAVGPEWRCLEVTPGSWFVALRRSFRGEKGLAAAVSRVPMRYILEIALQGQPAR